jgi:structural maintenance of chromosome 2
LISILLQLAVLYKQLHLRILWLLVLLLPLLLLPLTLLLSSLLLPLLYCYCCYTQQAAKEKELVACRAAVDKAAAAATAAAAAHTALQTDYQNMCAGVASAGNDEALTLTDQIAAAASEAAAADASAGQAALRSKHLAASAKASEKELKAAEKEVGKLRKDHAAAAAAATAAAAAVAALRYDAAAAAGLQAQRESDEAALSEAQHTLEALTAQLAGRLAFEYKSPHKGFDRSKVKGLAARLVTVPDAACATALEVAAGGKLYQVVVDDEQTGKALLQKGGLRRRVTIIPLNKISHRVLGAQQLERAGVLAARLNGTAQLAVELVGFAEDVRAAMEYVFGTTIVCDSLATAKAVAFDKGVRARTVTLEGDSFEPQGTLTGGSTAQLGVVLAKLRELQEVTLQVGALQERLRAVTAQLSAAAAAGKQHAKLQQQLPLAEEQAAILGAQLGASSAAQLVTRLAELNEGLAEAAAAAEAAKEAGAAARAKHAELTAQESSFRERREGLLQGLERRVTTAKTAAAAAQAALKKQQQKLQVLELEAAQLQQEGSGLAAQITQATGAAETACADVEALGEAVAAKREQYEGAKAALDALKSALVELDAKAKALRKEGEAAGKKVTAAELELKKMQHRVARFAKDSEAAGKHVALMLRKHPWIAKEREFFGRTGTDYDFAARDPDSANKRLKALQTEQAALGKKINKKVMGMIEKAESEYQELMHKKAVIETDKGKINSVIAELDQKKNQALQTTWVKVNRDFGSIFSTLLPGTSAKLEPLEGSSVLDGLEVKVAFGSVWKESLTELSGGQRSLLALSLILSLLLFKPAPMYILDEVDAALDLSHTENIGAMLKTHFSHSQFIVVSLKEGMFNNANVIYTTKFVDGVSAVHRAVVGAGASGGSSGAAARKALQQKASAAAASTTAANNGKGSRKKSKTAGSENVAA